MAKIIFGNHSSVIVPLKDRDSIRKFYCNILGGKITKGEDDRDFLLLGNNFYIFLYGDVPDESEFLRTARSVWLEIKSDDVEEMRRKILESGLVRKLDIPDPHLYFQAPGGQCWRLVGIDEDLSFYEGAGEGPNVAKVKEALKKMEAIDYHRTITANVSAEDAFEKINRVSEWWTKNLEGNSQNLNDVFTVRFGKTFVTIKLIEVVKNKKVLWHVTDCYLDWIKNKLEWKDTEMSFEISVNENLTQISFTHIGLVPQSECFEACQKGWDQYIKQSLFNLITEGKGLPDKF